MYLSSPDCSPKRWTSISNYRTDISIWMSNHMSNLHLQCSSAVPSPRPIAFPRPTESCFILRLSRPILCVNLTLTYYVQSVHKYYWFYFLNKSRTLPCFTISTTVNMVQITFNSHQDSCNCFLTSLPASSLPCAPTLSPCPKMTFGMTVSTLTLTHVTPLLKAFQWPLGPI